MSNYNRIIEEEIKSKIGSGKAIVLVGARQVGKTTLIKKILENKKYLFLNSDNPTVRRVMDLPNLEQLKNIIGDNKIIFIDEAQRINKIGLTVKLIIDEMKDIQVILSGSSSFDLGNSLNEPLTGRKWEYELFPISWEEYEKKEGFLKAEQLVEHRLLYGFYPDVLNNPGNEINILKNLVNSYLYRDLLEFSNIKKSEYLDNLIRALALQVGNEVNYNELSRTVGLNKNTIQKYIEILEKGYVVFKLTSFSKNVRNEIKRNRKIYFYDNGLRNMVIENFNDIEIRKDKGQLWENFLVSERQKQNIYKNKLVKMHFWRTKLQQEIDFIEVQADKISAYKFKWRANQKVKIPKTFIEAYKPLFNIIDRENFREFVSLNNT